MSGFSVIVDATFLKTNQRELFINLCQQLSIPLSILSISSSELNLAKRIKDRLKTMNNVSDADLTVLDSQIKTQQPLSDDELSMTIHIKN